jgi:urease subunit gamma/beta
VRLTPWEEERVLIFTAAELARRHREAGVLLSAPEAVALIADAILEAARAGSSYQAVEAAGREAVAPSDVIPGVRALVDLVSLEVLLDDGTRLIALVDPIGATGAAADELVPGAVVPAPAGVGASAGAEASGSSRSNGRERLQLTVTNTSRRVVRVSSHFPFDQVNARLQFDRRAARGFRLDLDAGSSHRWGPGETTTVSLVRFGGSSDVPAGGTEA